MRDGQASPPVGLLRKVMLIASWKNAYQSEPVAELMSGLGLHVQSAPTRESGLRVVAGGESGGHLEFVGYYYFDRFDVTKYERGDWEGLVDPTLSLCRRLLGLSPLDLDEPPIGTTCTLSRAKLDSQAQMENYRTLQCEYADHLRLLLAELHGVLASHFRNIVLQLLERSLSKKRAQEDAAAMFSGKLWGPAEDIATLVDQTFVVGYTQGRGWIGGDFADIVSKAAATTFLNEHAVPGSSPHYHAIAVGLATMCAWGKQYGEGFPDPTASPDAEAAIKTLVQHNRELEHVLSQLPDGLLFSEFSTGMAHVVDGERYNFSAQEACSALAEVKDFDQSLRLLFAAGYGTEKGWVSDEAKGHIIGRITYGLNAHFGLLPNSPTYTALLLSLIHVVARGSATACGGILKVEN